MKTKAWAIAGGLAAAGLALTSCATTPKVETPARVKVTYVEPEKFTDVKETWPGTDKERDSILEVLRDFIVERAAEFLPPGQKLELTFRDIDLAGDFEPWRGIRLGEIRIVKELYPPRMKFDYRILTTEGKLVREGQADLRDLSFMLRSYYSKQDSYRFEKEMLDDWFRTELQGEDKRGVK